MLLNNAPGWLFLLSLASAEIVVATPSQGYHRVSPKSIPLRRRSSIPENREEIGAWAKSQREALSAKYGNPRFQKRTQGTNELINVNADSSYLGTLAVGTPLAPFDVILDTGSADFWLADTNCVQGCRNITVFNTSDSASFANSSRPFEITYGSGRASGTLGTDTVRMAGFEIPNQVFAVCDVVSPGLLTNPASGLMGLGWQPLAASGATPFWQTLVEGGVLDEPLFAFHLSRFINSSDANSTMPGGAFNLGFTNQSLYENDIEYIDLPARTGTYWLLPLSKIDVNNTPIDVPGGQVSYAAIDTGTTLIGGPANVISQIYAQIPGSTPGTGDFAGYYTFPCNESVRIFLTFNGKTAWPIDPADFRLTQVTETQCMGAFFDLTTGGAAPDWIVGDTFLKNVYSVFRYSPASVGFATLSPAAIEENSVSGSVALPSATDAAASAASVTVTATSVPGAARSLFSHSLFALITSSTPAWFPPTWVVMSLLAGLGVKAVEFVVA
ncbi:hypothetical protein AX16_008295 [Volvariella volvacea WC 439]|nr:hypothetical protein AX16_008295 [Volvariella volvacea WC 439]